MYQCLLFRLVSAPGNGSAVLLTEVAHGLHDRHMRKELLPQGGEQGVTHWLRRSCCCLLVQVPDPVFGSAAGCQTSCTQELSQGQYGTRVVVSVHMPILVFLPV